MNFKVKENVKAVEDMTAEEAENAPSSQGFFYSIEEGFGGIFIELLEDEETKKACYNAITTLQKLERATEPYVLWY